MAEMKCKTAVRCSSYVTERLLGAHTARSSVIWTCRFYCAVFLHPDLELKTWICCTAMQRKTPLAHTLSTSFWQPFALRYAKHCHQSAWMQSFQTQGSNSSKYEPASCAMDHLQAHILAGHLPRMVYRKDYTSTSSSDAEDHISSRQLCNLDVLQTRNQWDSW